MNYALIFDFGGVLMKTIDYTPRHKWDEILNLPPGSVERAVHNSESWKAAQRGEIQIDTYWSDVQKRLKLSDSQLIELRQDFYAGDQLDRTLINYIEELKSDNIRVALLSNDSVELRPKLERLGILNLFDPLIISAEIGVMKPDKSAYQAVLDQLALPAEQTIFIDDLLKNIEGARELGIRGLHYHADMNLPDTLETYLQT